MYHSADIVYHFGSHTLNHNKDYNSISHNEYIKYINTVTFNNYFPINANKASVEL